LHDAAQFRRKLEGQINSQNTSSETLEKQVKELEEKLERQTNSTKNLKKLKQKLAEEMKDRKELHDKCEAHEAKILVLEQTSNTLSKHNDQIKKLEEEMTKLRQSNEDLRQENTKLMEQNKQLSDKNVVQVSEIESLKAKFSGLEEELKDTQQMKDMLFYWMALAIKLNTIAFREGVICNFDSQQVYAKITKDSVHYSVWPDMIVKECEKHIEFYEGKNKEDGDE